MRDIHLGDLDRRSLEGAYILHVGQRPEHSRSKRAIRSAIDRGLTVVRVIMTRSGVRTVEPIEQGS